MKLFPGFRQSSRLPSDSFIPKELDCDLLRSLKPPPGLVLNDSQASLFRFRDAVVVEEIPLQERGIGRVKYRWDGSIWNAYCLLKIKLPVGTLVQVLGREGLTLVVRPFDDSLG